MNLRQDLMNFVQNLRNRNDFFGVRENIANALEKLASFLDVAKEEVSKEANDQIDEHVNDITDELENRFDVKFDEYKAEVADVNAAAEVVNARQSTTGVEYLQLKGRLDNMEQVGITTATSTEQNKTNIDENTARLTDHDTKLDAAKGSYKSIDTRFDMTVDTRYNTYYYSGSSLALGLASVGVGEGVRYDNLPLRGKILYVTSLTPDLHMWYLYETDTETCVLAATLITSPTSLAVKPPLSTKPKRFGFCETDLTISNVSTFYVYGGVLPNSSYSNAMTMYSNATASWSVKATSSEGYADTYLARDALNKNIYILGGTDKNGQITNNVMRYNEVHMSFYQVAPMLTARRNFTALLYSDFIYVFGGETENGITNTVEKYTISLNKWEYMASMSVPRTRVIPCGFGVSDPQLNRWYMIGGTDDPTVEYYEYLKDIWYLAAPIPIQLKDVNALSITVLGEGTSIAYYVLGSNSPYIFALDPQNNSWISKTVAINYNRKNALIYAVFVKDVAEIRIIGGTKTSDNTWCTESIGYITGKAWYPKICDIPKGGFMSVWGNVILDSKIHNYLVNIAGNGWSYIPWDATVFGVPGTGTHQVMISNPVTKKVPKGN